MIDEGVLVTAATVLLALVAVTLVIWLLHAAWSTARERRIARLRAPALQALANAIREGDSGRAVPALAALDQDARVSAVVDMAFTVAGDQRERLNSFVRDTEIWIRALRWSVKPVLEQETQSRSALRPVRRRLRGSGRMAPRRLPA